MDDVMMPEWIRNKKAEIELSQAKAEAIQQRASAWASKVILEGPEFWRQFLMELRANVDQLKELNLSGRFSAFGNPRGGEQRCRVEVAQTGLTVNSSYIDIFYTPGESKIRSLTLEGEANLYAFCVQPNGERFGVWVEGEFAWKTAKGLAEDVVQAMATRVV